MSPDGVSPQPGNRNDEIRGLVEEYNFMVQELERSAGLLAQSERESAWREMAKQIAHEIKNPLGGLRGAAQLLERELPDDSLYEYTHIIIDEADRLQSLLNRMLGPNKLPQRSEVNIHRVLERVRQLVAAEVGGGVRFRVDYDPSIPEPMVDRDQLVQAVLNIARNAAHAIDGVGEVIFRTRICRQHTIGYRQCKHVLQIDIVDHGPGISEELMENMFLPMVTDKADGTGLGLPIAQQIIVGHEGIIQCHSQAGQTTFTILLPLD